MKIQIPLVVLCLALPAPGQQPQNPSPMVEHTRVHPRLKQESPSGRREKLELGTLFLPAGLKLKGQAPLFVFFHGGTWLPELAAVHAGHTAVISIQIGVGSGTYAKAFDDLERFGKLIAEAEAKAGVKFAPVTLGGFSAGCQSVREILKTQRYYDLIPKILLIDGIHTGYVGGKPGPQESQIETENLQILLRFARDAVAGKKQMIVTHSEIFPGTFASTTETADYLLAQLGLKRRPTVKWGPMQMQQLSEVRQGRFLLVGYAGNSAPDHVDQLHSLPDFLRWRL